MANGSGNGGDFKVLKNLMITNPFDRVLNAREFREDVLACVSACVLAYEKYSIKNFGRRKKKNKERKKFHLYVV